MKSAFSAGVHSRPTTSLQLRLNHFSTFAGSLKRSPFAAGDSGSMALPVTTCRPALRGLSVWQAVQLDSFSETPQFFVAKARPRVASAAKPGCARAASAA